MTASATVEVKPISTHDVPAVAEFLNRHLNPRVSAEAWARAIVPPWSRDAPNHGFMLTTAAGIVGAYLAFYSERRIDGGSKEFCNMAAFCVLEEYRTNGLRLVRALLGQPAYHFTDLSPSGNVIQLNKRLGFTSLDTTTVVVPNLPWPPARGVRVVCDANLIERTLRGNDRQIFDDHREASAVRHILLIRGQDHCYVMVRKDRRKRLPIFASLLYVGNSDVLEQTFHHLCRHLLIRHRLPVTMAELRVTGFRPTGVQLSRPRPKMFKSKTLGPADIDYLYSELTCVAW